MWTSSVFEAADTSDLKAKMQKGELKKKPKKTKKVAGATSETKIAEDEPAVESYVAGEVSDSLFPKKQKQSTSTLSSLFDTKASSAQPLYVPVVVTKTKRKLPEPEDAKPNKQASTTGVVKKSKVAKKELSVSEKRVEDREQALANADEEEKLKTTKLKNKKNPDYETIASHDKKRMIMAEERVKCKRTVFVGNLPTNCTKQMLKACFKEFGSIESMRFRSMARADPTMSRKYATIQRNVHPKRKSMNAYVVFKEQESATKALARNGNEIISGFHIRVDRASEKSSHDNKKTVFVGNLPYDIEDEALREHFSQCGTIEGVRVIRDKKTGIGKGFGYVFFQGIDSVQLALKLANSELMGRTLRIKRYNATEVKGPQNKGTVNQKGQDQKNNTFVGETADGTKSKNKRPKYKTNKTATKSIKKPNKNKKQTKSELKKDRKL